MNNSTSQLLQMNNITNDKCISLIADNVNQCTTKYSTTIPNQLSQDESRDWGEKIGQCTEDNFINNFINNTTKFITKDQWIKHMAEIGPARLCRFWFMQKITSEGLKAHNMTYEKCLPLAAKSLERCFTNNVSLMPNELNMNDIEKWSREISKCAGDEFYDNYIVKLPS